ncbi:uncharacterized protein F4812DRAFT_465981 [Daldinia caldariorum]|uniref:uncharacterized protein n=1 Tax=Daldinia caldariorum TaxID=326644 RepID=UPI002008A21D|nr:uncharacterized protein F4812DRAFT_465981 [Daldinia caldariorum]KAI1466143.1 hypothetical protein F4812DRAFT_465981 [Daldinia caldariorum]
MCTTVPDADNTSTPGENTSDEVESNEHVSSEDESDSSTIKASDQHTPEVDSSDEDVFRENAAKTNAFIQTMSTLLAVSERISELSINKSRYVATPQANGLFNRSKLGLPWGVCYVENCLITDTLCMCSGCKAVFYCSKIHQVVSFQRHKEECRPVRDMLKELAEEESKLREYPGDDELPANPFETAPGLFNFSEATSPYLDAKCRVISALSRIDNGLAVEHMLFHCLEMLKLEATDERWCLAVNWEGYRCDNIDPESLGSHEKDVFEDPNMLINSAALLSHLVCVTQVKIRLLLDLRMLQREAKKYGPQSASYETKMQWVREHAISEILYKRPDIVKLNSWKALITSINDQVKRLYKYVESRNKYCWPALAHPEQYLQKMIFPEDHYERGSEDEMGPVLLMTWKSWAECRPALTAIRIYATSDLGH